MIVENVRSSDELMEDILPIEIFINELKEILYKLESFNPEEKQNDSIEDFYEKIKDWSIVTIEHNNKVKWLQLPMNEFEINVKLSLKQRLKFFLKDSKWVAPDAKQIGTNVVSNVTFPMEVKLPEDHYKDAKEVEVLKFYYTIFNLLVKTIEITAYYKTPGIAIYKKSDAVIAMNRMNRWIYESGKKNGVDTEFLTATLNVQSLSEEIENSVLVLDDENSIIARAQTMLGLTTK